MQPDSSLKSIKGVEQACAAQVDASVPRGGAAPRRMAAPAAAVAASRQRDADLVAAWQPRDYGRVLEGLMQRYRQKVVNLSMSIVREPALAEDMAQLAFMKTWRALPTFDGRASLSTWLYTIVRNTCLSELRGRGRTVSIDDEAAESIVWKDERDLAREAQVELDAATLLDELAEPARTVVVLFYLEDRSCEEVGQMLGMPAGTVKSLLFRARKQLAARAG